MFSTDIFPVPRSLSTLDGRPAGRLASLEVITDFTVPVQGYHLLAQDGRVEVRHSDEPGLRYALATLAQIRMGGMLDDGAFHVEDWPDFAVRGYMLDVSRDRVPNRLALRNLVELLERARYNQLELYTEHTFAYRDHPGVWQHASPLTADDIRWLDGLCASAGIALVPNQNILGHMERWLAHPDYAHRAEKPEGVDLTSEILPPTTLAPTPENARFVGDLLGELLPLFRTRRVNIDCDEPWELGAGTSRAKAEAVGLGRVYTDYVAGIIEPWTGQGYEVEYWADVIAHHPDAIDDMPTGAIPVVWMYNTPNAMQRLAALNDAEEEAIHAAHEINIRGLLNGFRDRAATFIERGVPFWVAPGTNAWRSLIGRLDEGLGNLIDAAEVGLENNSKGYLVTSWGNNGYWDPPTVSVPPIAAGGAFSWALEANRGLGDPSALPEVLNRHFFDDASGAIGQVLCDIGRIADSLGTHILNTTPLWVVLQSGGELRASQVPTTGALADARRVLSEALVRLDTATPTLADAEDIIKEIRFVIDMSVLAIDLIHSGVTADSQPTASDAAHLLARLERLLHQHEECWLARARRGGLRESLAVMDTLRGRLTLVAAGESAVAGR
ncbi:glycoside hydrolase [Cryobacterium sp. N19]|uniref:family 20 glycosylhydrolase n=1 Tax=Cryobacterium sp. N19 TaxID=2048288 RepID=UPI000CE56192|nr:glycoside hydrolase [Cryobacterium sp. N19]